VHIMDDTRFMLLTCTKKRSERERRKNHETFGDFWISVKGPQKQVVVIDCFVLRFGGRQGFPRSVF
jgi:hypothetical protein